LHFCFGANSGRGCVIRVSLILGSESAPKIGKRGAEDLGVARTAPLRFPYLIAYWPWAFYDPLWKAREVPVAREQRKLAAILAADVVGYSRLMGRDESGTLARLREHRKERLELEAAASPGSLFARVPTLNCPNGR
jgi:hypothetical protein